MGYYRFTQWISLEGCKRIARNSPFEVRIARKDRGDGKDLFAVLRSVDGRGERFESVEQPEDYGVEQVINRTIPIP